MGIRIGNGCGFWGDNADAPILLAQEGRLDCLTLEYLAELTMSILALQKQRDPQAGFARDFLDVLARLLPGLQLQPRLKSINNACGRNGPGWRRLRSPATLSNAAPRSAVACGVTGKTQRTWPTSAIPSPTSTPTDPFSSPSPRTPVGRLIGKLWPSNCFTRWAIRQHI